MRRRYGDAMGGRGREAGRWGEEGAERGERGERGERDEGRRRGIEEVKGAEGEL